MKAGEYGQFMLKKGSLSVPVWLLERLQVLNIAPEELGPLLLAMHRAAPGRAGEDSQASDLGRDPWVGWALSKGWAVWEGDKAAPELSFSPLWNRLYQIWEEESRSQADAPQNDAARRLNRQDFDYCAIIKELDRLKGGLGASAREKQFIQELNIKYGWSTEFILNFYRLVFRRGLTQIKSYRPLAESLCRAGVFTLEGLVSFMDGVDWISQKAQEVKRDYLGLYGMVKVGERELYVKWHVAWQMSHGVICRAAEESTGAANASFKYLDRVLEDWHEQGVASLEDCEALLSQRRAEKEAAREARSARAEKSRGARQRGRSPAGPARPAQPGGESLWAGYEKE